MNLSEKQKTPVVKQSVVIKPLKSWQRQSNAKPASELSLAWLKSLGMQQMSLHAYRQQEGELKGCLLPRWFCLLEVDPDDNDHFIKGYN